MMLILAILLARKLHVIQNKREQLNYKKYSYSYHRTLGSKKIFNDYADPMLRPMHEKQQVLARTQA